MNTLKKIACALMVLCAISLGSCGTKDDPKPVNPNPTIDSFTVSFNVNGGTPAAISSQRIRSGQTASAPANPTKTDSVFGGWYTSNTTFPSSDSFNFTTAITQNITLYARWLAASTTTLTTTDTFTVSFNVKGGTPAAISSQRIRSGQTASAPANPTKTDSVFGGWYTSNTTFPSSDSFNFTTAITQNITLYARWLAASTTTLTTIDTFTVSFNINGGTPAAISSQRIRSGQTASAPANPTKTDSVFGGWYTSNTTFPSSDSFNFTTAINQDIILYAKWISLISPLYIDLRGIPTLLPAGVGGAPGYDYVIWLEYGGQKIPVKRFPLPNISGHVSTTIRNIKDTLWMGKDTVKDAAALFLSMEPTNKDVKTAGISKAILLAGDFVQDTIKAGLNMDPKFGGFATDFLTQLRTFVNSSRFLAATLTDTANANDNAGIWFVEGSAPNYTPGFKNLPNLPDGWIYEAWLVTNGYPFSNVISTFFGSIPSLRSNDELDKALPFSIGKFSMATGADDRNPYSSNANAAPAFPGEDFLTNTETIEPYKSVPFPYTPTKGRDIVLISIEPQNDDDPYAPFIKVCSNEPFDDWAGRGKAMTGGRFYYTLDDILGINPSPKLTVSRIR